MGTKKVKAAVLAVLPDRVWHFTAPQGTKAPYIVWGEDGQGEADYTDNEMAGQAIQGTVDYFTKTENDPLFSKLQKSLSLHGIPFYLRSIQYEEETGFIHYQWVWEVTA